MPFQFRSENPGRDSFVGWGHNLTDRATKDAFYEMIFPKRRLPDEKL